MNIEERNKLLCNAFKNGEKMTSISNRTGISCTQLSRIFREAGVKRKLYELDLDFFELNKHKTKRQISEETGITVKRVDYLYKIAYNTHKRTSGKTNFSDSEPQVDRNLLFDFNWMYEQYITNMLGTPTIAKLLATSSSKVIKQLRIFGIQLRTSKESSKLKEKRPSKEWLNKHYNELRWSIDKCAEKFGTGFTAIYSALRDYKFDIRDASQQHIGELNEFYGKKHNSKIAKFCAEIGAKYGKLYWLTGDVTSKIEQVTAYAKEIWADPVKRAEQSKRITKLCMRGKCNSKKYIYIRERDGKSFLFRSSWEYALAVFFESCGLIQEWDYEQLSIPYVYDGVARNFTIDFIVQWKSGLTTYVECKNRHLLQQPKEQTKISAAKNFLGTIQSNLTVVSSFRDILQCQNFPPSDYQELANSRYYCGRLYLKYSELYQELLRHHIMCRVRPWQDLKYSDVELDDDIKRLRSENIDLYWYKGDLRTTVPNQKGMAGRAFILHYQPHFLRVVINDRKTLIDAFDDKWTIYKSILQSMYEHESLTLERLLREINHHFTKYGRTSHFAPGFARAIIKYMNMSGKTIFDPCCGWGGRLIGAYLEGCEYNGCDISPNTFSGLLNIANHLNISPNIKNMSCLDCDWGTPDLVLTSPPFFDIEEYIGGEQPWETFKTRNEWIENFIRPFVIKIGSAKAALYLDNLTKNDFESIRKFDEIIEVKHRRHSRQKVSCEYLCIYR